MEKLRVLVADDTIVYRKVISQAVEATGLGAVEHTASNGALAVEWVKQGDIDVVLLDVNMPEMDGLEALRIIKKAFPKVDVIMISSGGADSAEVTINALAAGAMDFVLKPSESNMEKNLEKIKNQLQTLFTQIKLKKCAMPSANIPSSTLQNISMLMDQSSFPIQHKKEPEKKVWTGADIVVIASSTGGPNALETICSKLLPDISKPILIVQHMPPEFTKMLAQSISKKCQLKISEGQNGDLIKNGEIIIAPGAHHMVVTIIDPIQKAIQLLDTPYVNGVRPAADVLFNSVAKLYEGRSVLAVVLTGMGSDGMQGVSELKSKTNCYCITQSEASCVVYGMPRCVVEAGLSDESVDLNNIAARIRQLVIGRR